MTPIIETRNALDKNEVRKISKPLMEKRRRARINHSLAELRNLLLDTAEKENPRNSKLEKADILEMTVTHLQQLHRQHRAATMMNDPQLRDKFRAGFEECIQEVQHYLEQKKEVRDIDKQRLLGFLNRRLSEVKDISTDVLDDAKKSPSGILQKNSKNRPVCINSRCYYKCQLVTDSTSNPMITCESEENTSHSFDDTESTSKPTCRCGITYGEHHTQLILFPKRASTGEFILIAPNCMTTNTILNSPTRSSPPTPLPLIDSLPQQDVVISENRPGAYLSDNSDLRLTATCAQPVSPISKRGFSEFNSIERFTPDENCFPSAVQYQTLHSIHVPQEPVWRPW